MIPFLYALLALLPAVLFLGALEFHSRLQRANALRLPVTDKLLRSPGESAFKKFKELDHKVIEIATLFTAVPGTVLAFYLSFKLSAFQSPPGIWDILAVVGAVVTAGFTVYVIGLLKSRDHWRQGFRGEQLVGEELNKLMSSGCRVFHDFPLGENWNLDHVVVAPSGVYAIETKTISKKPSSPGQRQAGHEIIYDGQGLQFPGHYDTGKLDQAQAQADRLARFLGNALQESVYVNPILTFPGWYVTTKRLGEVTVLNPKQIQWKVVKSAQALSPDKVKRIARLLEEKCRDVSFG